MTEIRKSFNEHLREVPNPASDGRTKGTLEEFRIYGGLMRAEAARRAAIEPTGEEVREFTPSPILAAKLAELAGLKEQVGGPFPETKLSLGKNYVTPRNSNERGNHE